MRDVFERHINWDALGSRKKDEYKLEIKGATLKKAERELVVSLCLNFVVPYENEQEISAVIVNTIETIDSVSFDYEYKDMVQSHQESITALLPKLIKEINGEYTAITESIVQKPVSINGNEVSVYALGSFMCDRLNEDVAKLFSKLIENKLGEGYKYKVRFVNDDEVFDATIRNVEEASISSAKEVEELSYLAKQESLEAKASTPPTAKADKDAKTNDSKPKKKRNDFFAKKKAKEAPVKGNIIMGGKNIKGKVLPIDDLDPAQEKAVVGGIVFSKEMKVFQTGTMMAKLYITDKKNSVLVKTFISENKWKDIEEHIKEGDYIVVLGQPKIDPYENENLVLWAEGIEKGELPKREDNYEGIHRVELHCHTKMSRMDGLNDVGSLLETAVRWKQPAIAITDHGIVQSFPDAREKALKLAKKGTPIKVIYGMEGYVFDDADCIREDGSIDIKKKNTNHIILLAVNQEGIKNLYRLVSFSHLDYFYKRPRLPKSVIAKHREGLIIGSACEAGEVFQTILSGASEERIDEVASFYDYLEIQPLINNQFMVDKGIVANKEELRELNRKVIQCGERLDKLVCATTDAHYDEPESAIYRNAILGSMGFDNAENGQGLYLRTTEEMLEEFAYLGEELAYKVVVENPNTIADLIDDDVRPVPEGKFAPVIENSDEILRESCLGKAKEIYGDPLPDIIEERLSIELDSIISNKYSVMYVASQMLVNKSMEAGYMVGSRGSVGSSLVATMAGITEVNPLDPHYVCPSCKHIEWGDRNLYECGLDMPEKPCPKCGTIMKRDGFTIPFATFLGFKGDKEPDIDLNFAGEYQAIAHRYVGEIFGEKNVFKAGTVETIKEKNAFRIVKKFQEETGISYSNLETYRIALGCQGVKSTTGQHPGGIIIVPDNHEVYEFCPVQHPANKDTDIITTHFDYHKLENNLLKLDILGHTGPSMFRHLYDMTGIDPMTVDITDKDVLSIFTSTDALGIKEPDYAYDDGTFGIPEFGTHFVRGMLKEIRPTKVADLVRIAGFSHGTDVWTNNAQDYVNQGVATIDEVISTRDDIMNYLILKGIENAIAFAIMEDVRKNRPLKDEQISTMKEHGVPEWYIDSCKKIQYMFPRAHAAAYVMTSMRMAWYKVHCPAAFYAAYLTASSDAFEASVILKGPGACLDAIRRIEGRSEYDVDYEKKEKDKKTKPVYEAAYEMYSRGYRFRIPKLGESEATRFMIKDDEVILPFVALEGVGLQAAKSLKEAYDERPFATVEDVINRAKINKTVIEALRNYDVLNGIPESDQLSFFEM